MAEESENAGHGIIEVDARRIVVGSPEWDAHRERHRAEDSWKRYFPDVGWLEDQLARAKRHEPDRLFRPWKDWGWFMERMLANRMLLESAINKGSTIDAVLYGAELNGLVTEARIKFKWEKFALSGLRSSEGASEGGKTRGASDLILDRRTPLIDTYRRKRGEGWEHDTAVRYAIERTDYAKQKPLGPKQARRILSEFK